METCPLVSIITVVYNGAEALEKTILSIINQTYTNIEFIIIDGGSTDNTIEIIKKYEQSISYWVSEKDKGIYDAMNKGIERATGSWINFMNVGDHFYDENVISDVFSVDRSEYDFIYGDTEVKSSYKEPSIEKPGDKRNFWRKIIRHQSIFSKADLNKKYPFKTQYRVSADFDFIYQMFFYQFRTLYVNRVISSFDLIGFSHENRYIGFRENRKIAFAYKGNKMLSFKVYMHYIYISCLSHIVHFVKSNFPTVFKALKRVF